MVRCSCGTEASPSRMVGEELRRLWCSSISARKPDANTLRKLCVSRTKCISNLIVVYARSYRKRRSSDFPLRKLRSACPGARTQFLAAAERGPRGRSTAGWFFGRSKQVERLSVVEQELARVQEDPQGVGQGAPGLAVRPAVADVLHEPGALGRAGVRMPAWTGSDHSHNLTAAPVLDQVGEQPARPGKEPVAVGVAPQLVDGPVVVDRRG